MNKEKQREQLHKLLDIVIDGNGFECRDREITGTLPTVFYEFSGHVNYLQIRLYPDGWKPGVYQEEYEFKLENDISDKAVETIRAAVSKALATKNLSDTLRRDVEKKEKELADMKKELADMKKELRKAEKKEGVA